MADEEDRGNGNRRRERGAVRGTEQSQTTPIEIVQHKRVSAAVLVQKRGRKAQPEADGQGLRGRRVGEGR